MGDKKWDKQIDKKRKWVTKISIRDGKRKKSNLQKHEQARSRLKRCKKWKANPIKMMQQLLQNGIPSNQRLQTCIRQRLFKVMEYFKSDYEKMDSKGHFWPKRRTKTGPNFTKSFNFHDRDFEIRTRQSFLRVMEGFQSDFEKSDLKGALLGPKLGRILANLGTFRAKSAPQSPSII